MKEINYKKVFFDVVMIADSYLGKHDHHESMIGVENKEYYIARRADWIYTYPDGILNSVLEKCRNYVSSYGIDSKKLRLTITKRGFNNRNTLSMRIKKE